MVRTIRRAEWFAALRVLAALIVPLALGLTIGNVQAFVPVAAGGLIGALADPGCSTQRRSLTIVMTALLGAACFLVGSVLGGNQIVALAYIAAVAFFAGLSPEFGTAGTRGASYVAICAAVGISAANHGGTASLTAWGLIAGGAWALALARGPFREHGAVRRKLHSRARTFAEDFRDHLALRTALGRHAARMGLAAAGAMTASFVMDRPYVGWIAVASLTLLRPDALTTAPSTALRFVFATVVGAGGALLVFGTLSSRPMILAAATVALFLAVSLRSEHRMAFTGFMTLGMLGLLVLVDPSPTLIVDARVVDTLVGAVIALGVWRLSTTRDESRRLSRELDRL